MKAIPINLCCLLISTAFYSCQVDEVKPLVAANQEEKSDLNLPEIAFDYGIAEGNDLPTLGRVLFYDPRLSINNTVSCSSCHLQSLAFADQTTLSTGFEKEVTLRNSMPIQNIVADSFFNQNGNSSQPTSLFWDGRQRRLESMVMEPIKNLIEMGTTDLNKLAIELAQVNDYKVLFSKAFPFEGGGVSPEKIGRALAAFLVSINSTHSKFDQSLAGSTTLTQLEMEGKALFFEKYDCNSCHQLQTPFNGYQQAGNGEFGGFADIGLDEVPTDIGVLRVSGNPEDNGKFKIPSLRNVALTAPYMHDGRFETLEEVMDHYSEGINTSENLDVRLREVDATGNNNGVAKQFHISVADKQAMAAFLNTLTDFTMLQDPKLSNPFKSK